MMVKKRKRVLLSERKSRVLPSERKRGVLRIRKKKWGVPISKKEWAGLSQMAKDLNCGDETECKIFERKLEAMDLKHFAVEKDGHCQFGAVLPHLGEKEFTVMDMRREVTYVLLQILKSEKCDDYDKSLKTECSEMNKSVKDYLKDLYTGKQWGDLITARIISEIYKIKLLLLMRGFDGPYPTAMDKGYTKTVYVILVNNHYTGTEPKKVVDEDVVEGESVAATGEDENAADDINGVDDNDDNNEADTSDVENMVVDDEHYTDTEPKQVVDENVVECESAAATDEDENVTDDINGVDDIDVNNNAATSDVENMVVDDEHYTDTEPKQVLDENVVECESAAATDEDENVTDDINGVDDIDVNNNAATSDVENMVVDDEHYTDTEPKQVVDEIVVEVSTKKRTYNIPKRVYREIDGKFICKTCNHSVKSARGARKHHSSIHAKNDQGPDNSDNMLVNKNTGEVENTNVVELGNTTASGEEVEGASTSDVENMVVDDKHYPGAEPKQAVDENVATVSTKKRTYNIPKRVYREVDGKFICKICNHSVNSPRGARQHHSTIHANNAQGAGNSDYIVVSDNAGNKKHKCSKCGKAFSYIGNLTKHQKVCMKM